VGGGSDLAGSVGSDSLAGPADLRGMPYRLSRFKPQTMISENRFDVGRALDLHGTLAHVQREIIADERGRRSRLPLVQAIPIDR
jgi:hypothetical protein